MDCFVRKFWYLVPLVAVLFSIGGQAATSAGGTVIEVTQTACQFLEAENGVDHGFRSTRKADCEEINARTGSERLQQAKTLELKPGKYIFRVTNENVPYELGFWLRGEGLLGRATLPSVAGRGVHQGETKDFVVELEEGEYLYSCPLNSTPDYRIVVKS